MGSNEHAQRSRPGSQPGFHPNGVWGMNGRLGYPYAVWGMNGSCAGVEVGGAGARLGGSQAPASAAAQELTMGAASHRGLNGCRSVHVCLASKTGVSAAVHVNGNHWRALLPVDGEGRPVAVTARDERWTGAVATTAAARWTHEHDIA